MFWSLRSCTRPWSLETNSDSRSLFSQIANNDPRSPDCRLEITQCIERSIDTLVSLRAYLDRSKIPCPGSSLQLKKRRIYWKTKHYCMLDKQRDEYSSVFTHWYKMNSICVKFVSVLNLRHWRIEYIILLFKLYLFCWFEYDSFWYLCHICICKSCK